jgi:hypothetical protein
MPTASASRIGGPVLALALCLLAGCSAATHSATTGIPAALLREARPIGAGPRFRPPVSDGHITGHCRPALGPHYAAHVELFAANRAVIVPAGIGTRPRLPASGGPVPHARCYGDVVTIDPTGVVLVRTGQRATLSDLFHAWGQPLSPRRLASFSAQGREAVEVFVDGQRRYGRPGDVPLTARAEIVLEVGPHVPPHTAFAFPRGL